MHTMSAPRLDVNVSANGVKADYIPAVTWLGSKPGYYFGTAARGTGYYLDHHPSTQGRDRDGPPPSKRARKSVQIAEDRNESRTIPTPPTTTAAAADALLAAAELRAAGRGGGGVVALTAAGAATAAAALKRAAATNATQRAEESHRGGAAFLMAGEVALYEHVAALQAFAADPAALYPVLLQHGVVPDLVQLLLHDNVDIAVAVTAVFLEWLDSDLLLDAANSSGSANEDAARRRRHTAVSQMAAALLRTEGAELLVENLARMQDRDGGDDNDDDSGDGNDDDVGRGVEDVLSLLENLLEINAVEPEPVSEGGRSVAAVLCQQTALVPWIFAQLKMENGPYRHRSLELLAHLVPREDVHQVVTDWSRIPRYKSTFDTGPGDGGDAITTTATKQPKDGGVTADGIEILLQGVGTFRKRQPAGEADMAFLENSGLVLAALLAYSPAAVEAFVAAQGVELVVRCLKERVYAGAVTLQWLDFAGSDRAYRHACEHLVAAGALRYLFPLFLGRQLPRLPTAAAAAAAAKATASTTKRKKDRKELQFTIEGTTVRILYALVRHLKDTSPNDAKERVLAKFVNVDNDADEESNRKVNRLVELLLAYDQRARLAEFKFFRSDVEETLLRHHDGDDKDAVIQLAALEAKLAAGGDILHRLAAIAGFCCTGSKRCHKQILDLLHANESGIGLIAEALEEFVTVLDEPEQKVQLRSYLEQI